MRWIFTFVLSAVLITPSRAVIQIDGADSHFLGSVQQELSLMRSGKRGVVCQELLRRLDETQATTEIRSITSDEKTWHPNDRKGTRSHVEPQDTKLRGSARTVPTNAIIFVHPTRIDPGFSLFKVGTFAHLLATAADINLGTFSGNFQIEEKRTIFFRNAWRDSLHLDLISLSDRVSTPEYQIAKKAGLIVAENAALFPILDIKPLLPHAAALPTPLPAATAP